MSFPVVYENEMKSKLRGQEVVIVHKKAEPLWQQLKM